MTPPLVSNETSYT